MKGQLHEHIQCSVSCLGFLRLWIIQYLFYNHSAWFKDEQCIDSRRILAVLGVLCRHIQPLADFVLGVETVEISSSNTMIEFKKSLYYLSEYCDGKPAEKCTFSDIILEILRVILKIVRTFHMFVAFRL